MTTLAPITLRQFGRAVLEALRDRYGATVAQIGFVQPQDSLGDPAPALETPCILLRVLPQEIGTTQPRGNRPGLVPTRVLCEAQLVLGLGTPDLALELAEFAADLMALVSQWAAPGARVDARGRYGQGNRWGLGDSVEPPELLQCQEGVFTPEINGAEALLVTWEQIVYRPEGLTASEQP